ncbi:hypothetical protein BMETH_111311152301, partial [methanotrophic bacterial endosymbiont of Bathymodiolus sp.]
AEKIILVFIFAPASHMHGSAIALLMANFSHYLEFLVL